MTKLAIFDIDGTIFRSSLLIELINGLVRNQVIPKSAKKEMEKEYLAWLNRKGRYEDYINKVIKIYFKHIKGKSQAQVVKIAKKVINKQKDRVYRFTRDLIKELKAKNYLLAAISGSPSYIVESYAKVIGFDLFFGSEVEVVKGKFTGKALNLDSANNKVKIVKGILREYPSIDLKKSVAVGDTESDLRMLKMVGRPIAFNPNRHFLKYAKKHKFEIVVERKDAVYKISNFKLLITK